MFHVDAVRAERKTRFVRGMRGIIMRTRVDAMQRHNSIISFNYRERWTKGRIRGDTRFLGPLRAKSIATIVSGCHIVFRDPFYPFLPPYVSGYCKPEKRLCFKRKCYFITG